MSRKRKKLSKKKSEAGFETANISLELSETAALPRIMFYLMVSCLFLMGAIFGFRQIVSPDLGFHLSSARWILENKAFPQTDVFTYTVTDHAYVDLQWLFQLTVFGIESLAGPAGITVLTTVLVLGFGVLLLWRVYRREGHLHPSAVWMLGLFFLGCLWEIRPHLFSWVLGSVMLLVLEEYNRGSRKWLPVLPVVMLVWVNSHSLFILGLVILGTYVFCELVRGYRATRKLHFDRRFLLWTAAAVLVCFLNPYHVKGVLFPLKQFFLIQGESGYKSTLTGTAEFISPFRFQEYFVDGRFVLFQPLLWRQLFVLLAIVGLIGGRKKVRLAEWILFAGFFYIFSKANKNFGYFVMVCFPAVTGGLHDLTVHISRILIRVTKQGRSVFSASRLFYLSCGTAAVLFIFLAAGAVSNRLYEMGWQGADFGAGFNHRDLPVDACRFINDQGLEGRILNCWDDGGYIGWATGQKVFICSLGDVIGLDFYSQYVSAREPEGFPEALKKWKPTVILVRYRITPYWLYHLHNVSKDWRMVFADDQTAVFLHDSAFPEIPALPEPQPGADYPVFDMQAVEQTVQQAIEDGGPSFFQWLEGSRAYPLKEMQKSSYYLHTNRVEACIGICTAGLQQASFVVPELMLNLGHALNAQRRYRLADRCYDAFLRADDDPVLAREISLQRQNRR